MKTTLLLSAIGLMAFQMVDHIVTVDDFSHNPPAGTTGAPGEGLCTNCHSSNALAADAFVSFQFDGSSYEPGEEYTVSLEINDPTTRNGFQIVALDESNANAGTLENSDSETSTATVNNRRYLRQTSSGSNSGMWSFKWVAPSEDVGTVTFYYSVNKANGNSSTTGDQILIGNSSVASAGSFIADLESKQFDFNYHIEQGQLHFEVENAKREPALVRVTDLSGRVIAAEHLQTDISGKSSGKVSMDSLEGKYIVVHLFVGNHAQSKKLKIG